VNIASRLIGAVKKATRPTAMIRVIFDYRSIGDGLKDVIERNQLFGHFLLGVLGDSELICIHQSADCH
jgi:hypothetical protein